MINTNLALFQFCDSNFPIGSFSHSFGLESYIQDGTVHDKSSFITWLDTYLFEQLVYSDGLAVKLAYDALDKADLAKIWELDRKLTMQNFAQETRHGTKQMGERMVKMALSLYDAHNLLAYDKQLKTKRAFGHPALGFTMVGHFLNVDKETTILYYLYSTVTSLVQNAVRAIPLGQTSGQKIVSQFQRKLTEAVRLIGQLDETEFGVVSPGLELSQMHHERVNIRIFMS